MDSQAYIHDEYDTRDISPEDVSQELDNVIQSYDTNEAAYTHDTAQGNDSYDHRGGKSNGTSDLGKEDQYKAKRKRKRDLQNERGKYESEIETESPPPAASPPPDWIRTSKDYLKITIIIFAILTFVLNVGPFKRFHGNPLFNKTRREVSRKYPIGITPIREIFTVIWPVIYAFQGIWMGMCLVAIFIKTKRIKYVDGCKQTEFTFLHRHPDIFPIPMLLLYAVGQLAITAYKFINDRELLMLSFIFLFVSGFFFHLSLISAVKGLHESRSSMTTDQVEMKGGLLQVYKWMLHLFYINAVALIATWQVVAGSLSLCKYLLHGVQMKPEVASAIAICVLVLYAASFFVFDVFVVNEPSRWIYTSYAALAAASVGSLIKIWFGRGNSSEVTRVQIVFFVIVVVAVATFKVVTIIVRVARERRRKNKDIDTLVKSRLTTL